MRRPTTALLAALAAAALLACGDRRAAPADSAGADSGAPSAGAGSAAGDSTADGATADGATAERRSLQLASLSTEAAAGALRDSLAGAGWAAWVEPATVNGAPRWRVHVLPTTSAELLRIAAHAFGAEKREALATTGAVPAAAAGGARVARVLRVNHGTKGMSRVLRWTRSPDGRALLAVDDPVSVEAEPVSDGFLLVSEGGLVVQQDSVWDVAPSPDWRWLAYAHAHLSRSSAEETLTDAEWRDLARRAGLDVAETRRRAFPASGMAYVQGVAVPAVRRIALGDTAAGAERRIDTGAGWRARWTASGALAAFGTAPRTVQDDSPSPAFVLVDPATGAVRDTTADAGALARVAWTEGPTLDISIPIDLARPRTLEAGARTIVSEGGWIRVRARGEGGAGRIVGPGAALAATATGRWVLALVRDPAARETESPDVAVVYELAP